MMSYVVPESPYSLLLALSELEAKRARFAMRSDMGGMSDLPSDRCVFGIDASELGDAPFTLW